MHTTTILIVFQHHIRQVLEANVFESSWNADSWAHKVPTNKYKFFCTHFSSIVALLVASYSSTKRSILLPIAPISSLCLCSILLSRSGCFSCTPPGSTLFSLNHHHPPDYRYQLLLIYIPTWCFKPMVYHIDLVTLCPTSVSHQPILAFYSSNWKLWAINPLLTPL